MKFVNINLSKLLKEKGFNEPCLACYDANGIITSYSSDILKFVNYNSIGDIVSAPLYQDVIDWFRINHNLISSATSAYFDDENKQSFYPLISLWIDQRRPVLVENYLYNGADNDVYFDDYYDALDEAIKEAIKLI